MEDNAPVNTLEDVVAHETIPVENESKKEETISFEWYHIVEFALYIVGAILIIMCIVKYGQDLETYSGEFRFSEKTYVGGDAYNYIISAARSSAVMVKSLIFAVLGSSSIISGLLIRIANKK